MINKTNCFMEDYAMVKNENIESENTQTYKFTDSELEALALFFRQDLENLPGELDSFSRFVEYYIYNKMTLAEADSFFNKGIN